MKISPINGGPAGLYFPPLMSKLEPHDDAPTDNMREWGHDKSDAIEQSFAHWDDIELLKGQRP
jgi:hypothetical protein